MPWHAHCHKPFTQFSFIEKDLTPQNSIQILYVFHDKQWQNKCLLPSYPFHCQWKQKNTKIMGKNIKKSMFVLQGKCKKKHKIKASSNSWNGRVTANQARAKMLPATLLSHWLPRPDLFIPVCIQHGSCAHSAVYKHSLILQNAAWIWTNPPCYKMFLGFLMVDQKPMWVTTKWLRKRVAVKNHDSLLNRFWKFHSKFLVYFPGPRS